MLTNTASFRDDIGVDFLRRGLPLAIPEIELTPAQLQPYTGIYESTAASYGIDFHHIPVTAEIRVTTGGAITCTGRNANGQLGTGNTTPSLTFAPIVTTGKPYAGLVWSEISSGDAHSCALAADKSVWCWGLNGSGQLGQSANPPAGNLVQVLPLEAI